MAKPNVPVTGDPDNQTRRAIERHGLRSSPIYEVWRDMLRRCYDPRRVKYVYYGGRGITVCERWRRSLLTFHQDMGDCPPGMELDRRDNDGNYEPDNCHWVTRQSNNRNRRDSIWLEHNGERLHLTVWAERTGISKTAIRMRLKRGMSVNEALTKPVDDPNRYVAFQGELMAMTEVVRRTGLKKWTILNRMKRHGLSLDEAATMPLQRKRK